MDNQRERKTDETEEPHQTRKARVQNVEDLFQREQTVGKVKRIFVRNFMCHDALEIKLNPNVNFIVGHNGSGKSAILSALVVGLGSKAEAADREKSIKDFIMKGKDNATVEITLTNAGTGSYKGKIYGDTITVCRTFGTSPSYRIINSRGDLVSSKKEELENIISAMNIQVDNPISVLNQDAFRQFLATPTPGCNYELFMKATRLDVIFKNYEDAHQRNAESQRHLKDTEACLAETKVEIEQLKKNLELLQSTDASRDKYKYLQIELQWSIVIAAATSLKRVQQQKFESEREVERLLAVDEEREEKLSQINAKMEELKCKLQEAEDQARNSEEVYETAKTVLLQGKDAQSAKMIELWSAEAVVKQVETDISLLRKEIERLEIGSNKYEAEMQAERIRLEELEHNLCEVEGTLKTKQTDEMHCEDNKADLQQQEGALRLKAEISGKKLGQITQNLSAVKRQSNNAMTVYGPNMPRLLKRIDEEFKKGRFKENPRGPVGSFIKLKDENWVPAVEDFLTATLLSGFCVDNREDERMLRLIMRDIFRDEEYPQIVTSKFHYRVHNVEQKCARSSDYLNLLDAMEISDPVIANCLIDQREIECVMLIPTSEEACAVMSKDINVPRNCKMAFTQQGDLFFPDPNYKTYGGKRGMRAKFLQVSTTQVIQILEEEKDVAEKEQGKRVTECKDLAMQITKADSDLQVVNGTVSELRNAKGKLKSDIASLRDKLEVENTNSIEVFIEEMERHQTKLRNVKAEEDQLNKEVAEIQTNIAQINSEFIRRQYLINELNLGLIPIKDEIAELNDQRIHLRSTCQNAAKKLQVAKQNVSKFIEDLEEHQGRVDAAIKNAENHGERVETCRTAREIMCELDDTRAQIEMIERECGSKDALHKELQEKCDKYDVAANYSSLLKISCEKHQSRLVGRKQIYREMKRQMGQKVQEAFANILLLRKYKGCLKIDHREKLLHLEVNPADDAKEFTNDATSLSGGETSYSTFAFILALWDCTGLPFYFLDEFGVFVDKISRRIIMDILLNHARSHPQSQFVFLTPLDTVSIKADDYVTIHQLAPPEGSLTPG